MLVFSAALAGAPAVASDDSSEPLGHLVSARTVGMVVVGINESVAAINGYEVGINSSGREYLVDADDGTMVPQGTVGGNCGTSSIWLYDSGIYRFSALTEWTTKSRAVSYRWAVAIWDNYGWITAGSWGGNLALRTSWSHIWTGKVPGAAYYTARAVGSVLLANGVICQSGQPTSTEYIS